MRLNRRALALVAICAVLPLAAASAQDDIAKRLVGTWRLVSIVDANGKPDPNRGTRPTGVIIYDAHGNMAVQIVPDRERPKFAPNKATPEQAQAAVLGYTAYFGTYSVDPKAGTVTHHRTGNITGSLGDFVRRYEFVGENRIVLRPVESGTQLTWERVK
jgi:hypothetical protein